jgi:catechol 2,3-dioxygenase-like lactoylglutathione lyase family enzyme
VRRAAFRRRVAPAREIDMSDTIRFTAVTPNLIVRDIARSTTFYRDVLGFTIKDTVPPEAPFVFVWLERGGVTVFLNDPAAVAKDIPAYAAPAFGGTATLFVIVDGVDALHAQIAPRVPVVMPLHTQPYGMREFAVHDPDGHLITFAERVAGA